MQAKGSGQEQHFGLVAAQGFQFWHEVSAQVKGSRQEQWFWRGQLWCKVLVSAALVLAALVLAALALAALALVASALVVSVHARQEQWFRSRAAALVSAVSALVLTTLVSAVSASVLATLVSAGFGVGIFGVGSFSFGKWLT